MIADWIGQFVDDHRERHPLAGLPDPETESGLTLYESWRAAFVHRGVNDLDVATEASKRLTGETLRHSSEHFPRLVALALEVYRERQPADGPRGTSPRESAEREARDCPHCRGCGMATVHNSDPRRWPEHPAAVSAYCVCPMGQFVEKAHRGTSPDVWKRTPHLANALAGRSMWQADPPGVTPELERTYAGYTPAELIRSWTDHARREAAAAGLRVRPEAPTRV